MCRTVLREGMHVIGREKAREMDAETKRKEKGTWGQGAGC